MLLFKSQYQAVKEAWYWYRVIQKAVKNKRLKLPATNNVVK